MKQFLTVLVSIGLANAGYSQVNCGLPHIKHEVDPAEALVDSIPPSPPHLEVVKYSRGHLPPNPVGPPGREVDLNGLASVAIQVSGLTDDRTSPNRMGIRLVDLGGEAPIEAPWIPDFDLAPSDSEQMFWLHWPDQTGDEQRRIIQIVGAFAVDLAGNLSSHPDTLILDLPVLR